MYVLKRLAQDAFFEVLGQLRYSVGGPLHLGATLQCEFSRWPARNRLVVAQTCAGRSRGAYDHVGGAGILRAACWADARQKFSRRSKSIRESSKLVQGADAVSVAGGNMDRRDRASACLGPARFLEPGMQVTLFAWEPGSTKNERIPPALVSGSPQQN